MLIAGFDLETTGFDGTTDHIVQYSFKIFDDSECIRNESSLVNPGVPVTASHIHGIYDDDVLDAPGEMPSLQAIDSLFNDCFTHNIPIVIMNAKFDVTFYRNALYSHYGIRPEASYLILDPLVIDKHFDKYRPGKRTLQALAGVYNVAINGAFHSADFDVDVAKDVAMAQLVKWDLGADWQRLHDLQSEWSDEQTKSLHSYFVASGNDAYKNMKLGWPIETELLGI